MSKFIYRTQKKKRPFASFTKIIFLFILFCAVAGSLLVFIVFAIASKNLPSPGSLSERTISQTTKIYDRTGEHLLYEIAGNQNRTLKQFQTNFCDPNNTVLKHDEKGIPLYAIQATVSAEDRKFCEHKGFDLKGFARAIILNIFGQRVGGSTLTQQLVKNAILSNEKTFTRKIKELILSIELERKYSKDELLQIYFNEIPYGSSYYGIEAASQNFFSKSVSDLSVAEAATLAALPKAPTTYLNNPDLLKARRDYILGEMKKLNFINEETYKKALNENTPVDSKLTNITAPHFVMDVKKYLEEVYGRRTVEEGGLSVITTLDLELQNIAEEEIKKGVEERSQKYGFSNASLVAEDPKTGQILAMVGSKDFFDKSIDGQVNVSTRHRQPGSSFKPIVYTKAFELGYTPNTVLWDVVTNFPTDVGTYTPHNYDLKERGPITMRDSLQLSLNIPAVKTVYLVGVDQTLDFATSLGYDSFSRHENFGLSLVLGGGEVRLVDHVNAYATLANEGKYSDQITVLKVEDAKGAVLEEWKQKDAKQLVDQNAARMITNVLSDNAARTPVFGAKSSLHLGERPVAAKSGTTNDYHDAWLMGYTPSLAAGVWVGNNNNTAMKNKADGSIVAGPIWNAFMTRAHAKKPIEPFNAPEIKKTGKPVLDGSLGVQTFIIDKASGKLATEYTPDSYKEKRVFGGYHEILQFVIPTSRAEDTPSDPKKDSHYEAWETGIQTWLQKRQQETGIILTSTEPPTETDDIHVPSNFPTIHLTSPQNNAVLNSSLITLSCETFSPRSLSRVEYYLDDLFLTTSAQFPFSLSFDLPETTTNGLHTLKAVVYDDVENKSTDSISIQTNTNLTESPLSIFDPKNEQTISKQSENFTIVLFLKDPTEISSVSLFVQEPHSQTKQIVGEIFNPSSPYVTIDWKLPESGTWILSAKATTKNSTSLKTAGTIIHLQQTSSVSPSETDGVYKPTNTLDPFFTAL